MEYDYYGLKHRRLLEEARRKREDGMLLFFTLLLSAMFLFLVGFGSSAILILAGAIVLLLGVLLFMYEDSQSKKILHKASEMESPPATPIENEVESIITNLLIEGISYLMKQK